MTIVTTFLIELQWSVQRVIIGRAAIDQIFRVINEQSQPTFDENFNFMSYYNWTGGDGALSPMVNNMGNGEPKVYTGLVGTHHRPSDDLSVFGEYMTATNLHN
jgi:meiotically up-regulated gene 157 (Mug157) protein